MMTYNEAKVYKMPLGKHRGKALDKIAESDEGLLYLDWLVGQDWVRGPLREALHVYLGDPVIALEVQRAMQDRG
jgi:uncharacterized protein (DUF3820 family)